jgi:ribokinase
MAILNVGSFMVDHVYQVPHFLRPGETLPATDYGVFAGGKGFNQTIALARAGVAVVHAGAIGRDGEWLLELLTAEGVDVDSVLTTETPTGHGIIQVTGQGDNAILQWPGANRTLTRDYIDRLLARYGPNDVLLLQNEVNEIGYLIDQGCARGMRLVFNPAPMTPDIAEVSFEHVSLLIVNEVEAFDLTGASTEAAMLEGLRTRVPRGGVVLTLGARGAVWVDASSRIVVPAWPVRAVDTTAAGDTFIGYLLASLTLGMTAEAAMRRAAKAAALCVTRPGAAVSIPQAETVDAYVSG